MTEYTPGPWIAKPTAGYDLHGQSVVYAVRSGADIAIVYDGASNASLIATAPELRRFVQQISELGDCDGYTAAEDRELLIALQRQAQQLVAKADGAQ